LERNIPSANKEVEMPYHHRRHAARDWIVDCEIFKLELRHARSRTAGGHAKPAATAVRKTAATAA
jgi:hypothetical protein